MTTDICWISVLKRYLRAFLWWSVRVATVHPSMRRLSHTVLVIFLVIIRHFPLSEMVIRFLKKVDGISPPRQTVYIACHSFMSALFLLTLSNPLFSVSLRFYGEQSKSEREKRDSTVEMRAVHFGLVFL